MAVRAIESEVLDGVKTLIQTNGGVVDHDAILNYLAENGLSAHATMLAKWSASGALLPEVVAQVGANAKVQYRVGGQ